MDKELPPAYAPGAHPVMVESMRDAGRHLEILVRPQEGKSPETWVLYDVPRPDLNPGAPAWVRVKE